jgi:mono/diheme cytochrome c family protein
MLAPEHGGDGRKRAEPGKYPDPVVAFPGHWAPLQFSFYYGEQFPAKYRGGAFMTFHGSWNRAPRPQEGFRVGFVPFDEKGNALGTYEAFALNSATSKFRMGGLAVAPDGSLYVSETDIGRIWRIIYTGDATAIATASIPSENKVGRAEPSGPPSIASPGKTLYEQICASCHMADGSGAGQMHPALLGSKVVKGDIAQIIRVVLKGPALVLPSDRPKYGNVMPAFSMLTDDQIASVLTYVRQNFGRGATAITPLQVAAQR